MKLILMAVFKEFDLNEFYYKEEGARQYRRNEYNIENRPINNMVGYDEFVWDNIYIKT